MITLKRSSLAIGVVFLGAALVLLSGCGAKEEQGGLLGGVSGAALGAAVAGRHSRGEGALVGGLLGGLVGSQIGRSSDEKDTRRAHEREVGQLKSENRNLQQQLNRWCSHCGRMVTLRGAQSCPDCGGELIQEKFCDRCHTIFSPDTGYQYCPYCKVKVKLQGR